MTNSRDVLNPLDRLLRVLCRSLPRYLEQAKPWVRGEHDTLQGDLSRLVADQQMLAQRTARAILQHGGRPDPGPFPMEFASVNDVALDRILPQILEELKRLIDEIQRCAAGLTDCPAELALAQEALGNMQGHLEVLQEPLKDDG